VPILNEPGDPARGRLLDRTFEGVSAFSEASSAESLHEAILEAAKTAAPHLRPPDGKETELFEVSRIQIEVGNPNVKIYRVEITPSNPSA
jgi:flavin-binding protein dodecin